MFKKVLIANRGEIALRVIATLKKMGIASVAVYSDVDAGLKHVREADEAVEIGPALSRKSYLNAERIIEAAKDTGAEAIHPGYGFLSENAEFARRCAEEGIVFIGPFPETIELAGEKANARGFLAERGIPVIPGSDDTLADEAEAITIANELGYPVMLKASGGGGGRGLRIATNEQELTSAFKLAGAEAKAAFANGELYLEKYLDRPRHIEVQLLADTHGKAIHLGERECSIQKRHQKLIEEAPSPFVDDTLRVKLTSAALKVAKAVDYVGAGTVEFLVDAERNFYFMELNSRIQVEHPVTEMVTGVDIVEQQLRIAAGEKLAIEQSDVKINGWAIECRINACNPENDFMPSPGQIEKITLPQGKGIRFDTHLEEGLLVVPFYDSLVGKLITHGKDRNEALDKMKSALSVLSLSGIATTAQFELKLIKTERFATGNINTHFIDV